ncbi:MAG: magnesium transporter, partial [Silicimonas sp.]|nr:magnesium transporter [Silicimonas sp.]
IEDLDEPQQEAILEVLDMVDRMAVEQALNYPEYSAGRLMQHEVVIAPEHWTVGDTIDHLRAPTDLPDQFYHIILVDPRHRPTAYVTLGRLMSSRRDVALKDITEESFRAFEVEEDEGDVAYAFNQYHMISAPVVDAEGRLAGVITIDDAMAVLDEEHEEDVLRLGGVGDESLSNSTMEIVKRRFPWLGVNLATAILASIVISFFEDVLTAVVALAVLMPIVASMGGNAGTQSMTVAVRALATRDLTGSNALRVVRREAMAGLLNGVLFAVVMGIVGVIWFGQPMIGVVIAVAMVINLLAAGLSGVLIPLALDKFGVDPALASGTFVTTVTDVVGFFAFLGLASVVLL